MTTQNILKFNKLNYEDLQSVVAKYAWWPHNETPIAGCIPKVAGQVIPDYTKNIFAIRRAVEQESPLFQEKFTKALAEYAELRELQLAQMTARDWCDVYLFIIQPDDKVLYPTA